MSNNGLYIVYAHFCMCVIIHNKRDKRLKCRKKGETKKFSLMGGAETELDQLGPGVGCLEVKRMERKLWGREVQILS